MPVLADIRFGCQTYSWQMSGDRFRGQVDHFAAVAADAGFAGLEPEVVMLGQYFVPARAAEALTDNGLALAAVAYASAWRSPEETEEERAEADNVIEFVASFPGAKLVLVQLPGTSRTDLVARQRNAIACKNAVARRALDAGVAPTAHPNSPPGSVFRTREDYEVLLDELDPRVGFTPDVGHIVAGGMDPLATVKLYRDRIDHVHFKDIHEDGTWAVTGEGTIDFSSIVSFLVSTDYKGWIIFEDESPDSEADPDAGARRNGSYARTLLPLLTVAETTP